MQTRGDKPLFIMPEIVENLAIAGILWLLDIISRADKRSYSNREYSSANRVLADKYFSIYFRTQVF